jgi:hypothetical protein
MLADNVWDAKIFGFVHLKMWFFKPVFTCMDHVHKVSDGDEAEGRADWRVGWRKPKINKVFIFIKI